ncbi:unnamed protein product [Ceutorhynchus assimilis]|uniref:Fatty acid synthase n=1 Tax=Ceutorhynchus assimilis TaxID=467358 RepID=A0A9P0GST6_9CUCU|nr:unnamed protein product [Ceutorhynchus assimilis]
MGLQDDEIVITGIAGRYPECDTFEEFKKALFDGVDLITEDSRRFEPGTYDVPVRAGKINNIEYFDAQYFGIHPRQARVIDPRHRIMFETAYEAIVDAGYNPKELSGTETGVYIGIGAFDSLESYKELENTNGYCNIGCSLGQIANRTSYCFDLKGPSFVLDTACASGLYALANAFKAMERGDIDGAIVSAVNINLHPYESKEFNQLNMLSPEGKCKVFATDRDGYARSEAIVTVLLQRKSKCRRMYSTVLGADTNCDGWKLEGITFPSSAAQLKLIRKIYEEKKLNPNDVKYIEMHGTGTPAGDTVECQPILDFFCKDRNEPLPIGAVKTNMGHSEISAGLCSLSKVLIAMEADLIPANLHCENIDYTLPGIDSGKMKVVTKNLPWDGGMVSLNCFGFGGANAHVVLKSNEKKRLKPKRLSHRLVNVSGRTEESVKYLLEQAQAHQDDQEFLALIDEIHKIDVEGHPYRGYSILGDNPTTEIKQFSKQKRPVWFVYSGMGSQWTGMAKDLMKIDVYRNTIKRCAAALKPYNVDLEHIMTSDDPTIFDDISNCFSAIAASEIALTDVVRAFGIEPDGFVGHSLGEVGCAYCNGELTPEQAMLIGFARGYATKLSKGPSGQMAAVGLSKEEIKKYLIDGVSIACINGSSSVTITGLKDAVNQVVASLIEKGIFARLVATAGYAFHSQYIDDSAPHLQEFVAKIITDPKPRSSKWISSSRPESEWNDPLVQLNCAEYHRNNYRNPVLFDQVLKYIPKDAIVIEIAPHGLLTAILKREMGPDVTCLSLANKNSKDNLQFLLSNIGKLFVNGGQPNLRTFYNEVSFPVGRGTTNIGSLVKWDHSVKWFTPFYEPNKGFGKKVTVNTDMEIYSYLKGHNIDGRVLMPASGYLELVWKVTAEANSKTVQTYPIVFESLKFLRATVLPEGEDVVFYINIMKQSGYFEIFEGGSVCCSGTIKSTKVISDEFINPDKPKIDVNGYNPLRKQDVYKWFNLKRYKYSGIFQGIESVDVGGTVGKIKWHNSFTSFLDTMIQISLVTEYSYDLYLPTRLQKLVIDPVRHFKEITSNNDLELFYDKDIKLIKSGGIELTNLEVFAAPKRQNIQADPVLESQTFVPYITRNSPEPINLPLILRIAIQIAVENNGLIKNLQAYEVVSNKENSLVKDLEEISKTDPMINLTFVDGESKKFDLILYSDGQLDQTALSMLNADGFVLFHGLGKDAEAIGLPVVYENSHKEKGIYLLRNITSPNSHTIIEVTNVNFDWMEKVKTAIQKNQIVYVTNSMDRTSGVLGLVKCLNLEPTEKARVKCILINDDSLFPDCSKQLSYQLSTNVLQNCVWGSFRHLPVNPVSTIDVSSASNMVQTIGDLSSLKWIERSIENNKPFIESEYVYVNYAALNFKDIMEATGKLHIKNKSDPSCLDIQSGFEYSGITESKRRVMGMGSCAVSLQLWNDPLFTWEVPKTWNLEQAATVPVVYATCYYGLIMRGQLQKRESILIHAGAGGIGIAAISIALSLDCEIFTTVGSQEKRDFLLKMFPKLKPQNIGNSRNASFEQMVLRNTKGAGVDMVLNSLSSELFQASIRCIAQRGRFMEIGKVDLWAGTPVSASLFAKNASFHGVLLDDFFNVNTRHPIKQEIHRLMSEGITKGDVQPLPATVFLEDRIEDAYRFLATGKHKGKVLIKIRDETSFESLQRTIKALPKIYFDPKKVYIVVGGLGGFGLELTNFLIKRYARKIVLNSRRGITNGYQSLCMKKWSEFPEVNVKVNTDDSSTLEGAKKLVKFSEQMGPVGGIFNMAMILSDALFVNQTVEKYKTVFNSKIYSGLNLDKITRAQCPKLDHFVVFSSLACGRGNPGQSNYGMANSALERLCEKRRQDGLPALAVQYGPVGDVGAVAENSKYDKTINVFGLVSQTITSCINALETFMLQPYIVGSTFVMDEENLATSETRKTPVDIIANILGIKDISLISNKDQCLGEMGLDSLMTAEIKQTLYRNYNIEIAAEDIRNMTFNKISQMFEKSGSSTTTDSSNVHENGHPYVLFNAMLSKNIINEVINDKTYSNKIFFIPPIEGNTEIMIPLAHTLKANIYALQFTKDLNFDNMQDYANTFIQTIKNVQSNGPYVLCGYSYGGALGFEIATQLEKLGDKVKLFLIDGTPSFVKRILEEKFNQQGKLQANVKVNVLKSFLELLDELDNKKINSLFDGCVDYEEQLIKLGSFVAENTSYNSEDASVAADRYFKRVVAGFFYHPTSTFKGDATLIRSDDVFKELPNDYDLQKICEQPIDLTSLKGNHREVLLGNNLQRISEIINNKL